MERRVILVPRDTRRSLAAQVVEWLDAHPDECLLTGDVVVKWGVSRFTALDGLRLAYQRGRVERRTVGAGEYEWFSILARQAAEAA